MDATIMTGENTPPPPAPLSPGQVTEWLDYCLAEYVTRREEEILPAMEAMLTASPTIGDDDADTAGVFAENIRMAATLEKDAAAEVAIQKRPYLDGGRACDGWRNRFAASLAEPVAKAKAALLAYENRKVARARAEAERLAQEAAERARIDAIAAAKAVQRNPFGGDEQLEIALASNQAAQKAAEHAVAKPAALSRTTGHYGASASITTRWSWEIEDFDKIPLEFLQVNDDAVKAAMKQRDKAGRPVRTIAGIRWVESRSIGVR